jgi:hypothetical protein
MADEGATIRAREREELRRRAGSTSIRRELEGKESDPTFSGCANVCAAIALLTLAVCNVGEELSAASPRRDSILNVG